MCINLTEAHTSHIFIYFVTLRLRPSLFPAMKIWIHYISACMEPHYFGKPSPDPHKKGTAGSRSALTLKYTSEINSVLYVLRGFLCPWKNAVMYPQRATATHFR